MAPDRRRAGEGGTPLVDRARLRLANRAPVLARLVPLALVLLLSPPLHAASAQSQLQRAAQLLEEKLRAAQVAPPVALWIHADSPPLAQALATLLAARLAQGPAPLAPFVVETPDARNAERLARAEGASSLLRLELTLNRERLLGRGDLLGTWENFWSGRTPTRPPSPAAPVLIEVPTDAEIAGLAGRPLPSPAGGTLRVAAPGANLALPPSLAATPRELALRSLTHAPLCRALPGGDWTALGVADVALSPEGRLVLTAHDGPSALGPEALLTWLQGLRSAKSPAPYAALLHPLRLEAARIEGRTLSIPLSHPWPDLPASLCHPALTPLGERRREVEGPFFPAEGESFRARRAFLGERPHLDRVQVLTPPERAAARLFGLGRVHAVLGNVPASAPGEDGPALWATFLLYRPASVQNGFAEAFERAVDRDALVRFFAEAPAVQMTSLLPPTLDFGVFGTSAPPASSDAGASGRERPRPLTLVYDERIEDQRRVAERLQVKLRAEGYALTVRPLRQESLREGPLRGAPDLMLQSVLLPKDAAPALAVVLTLAGRQDLLSIELPALGALSDEAARTERAKERVRALAPRLSLIPLYAQGMRILRGSGNVTLPRDVYGMPLFEDARISSAP